MQKKKPEMKRDSINDIKFKIRQCINFETGIITSTPEEEVTEEIKKLAVTRKMVFEACLEALNGDSYQLNKYMER